MTAGTEAPLAPGLAEGERVLRVLRRHEPDLRARGVTRPRLFGSMARGEAGPGSDVDLIAEIDPASTSRSSISSACKTTWRTSSAERLTSG